MAKPKPAPAAKPATRKVRVNVHRAYTEEEPTDDEVIDLEGEPELVNPVEEFLRTIEVDRQLTLQVFALPNFERDHKVGNRAVERTFVTSFTFTSEEVETYRQRVQYCYPQGGMFSFELRERGLFIKRWEEHISPAAGYEPPAQQRNPYLAPPPISIRMPDNGTPAPPVDPLEQIERQATMFVKIGEVFKSFQQPTAPTVINGQPAAPVEKPLEDRLLETVIIKALESDKAPIDKVLDALTGRRNQPAGFMDSLGPVLAELAKGLVPVLSMGIQQYARTAAMAQAGAQPGQPGQGPTEQPAPIQLPPADPSERAWRRVVQRLLEDCFEHVTIRGVSAEDGITVVPHAEAIVNLLDRFPEQLTQMIEMLLNAEPDQVVEMCAMLQPTPEMAEGVMALKTFPAALAWLVDLQVETKKILAEGGDVDASV